MLVWFPLEFSTCCIRILVPEEFDQDAVYFILCESYDMDSKPYILIYDFIYLLSVKCF